jgi:AraC-like DNA-binding protein
MVLSELGVSPESIFTKANVSLRAFRNPESRVSLRSIGRLLDKAAKTTGCAHLGLLIGARFELQGLGPIGGLMHNSATVGDALRNLVMHLHLHDRGAAAVLMKVGDAATIMGYSLCRDDNVGLRHIYDTTNAIVFRLLKELCGPEFKPAGAHFAYPPPPNADVHRNYFGCATTFNASLSGIRFRAPWLSKPIALAEPAAYRDLSRKVVQEDADDDLPFAQRVELVAHQILLGGTATAAAVAAMLNVSERTLRRKLRAEDQGFQSLLNRRRYALARQLLSNTSLPVADIATALQYKDANAFSRAFRGWARRAPSEWRSQTRAG